MLGCEGLDMIGGEVVEPSDMKFVRCCITGASWSYQGALWVNRDEVGLFRSLQKNLDADAIKSRLDSSQRTDGKSSLSSIGPKSISISISMLSASVPAGRPLETKSRPAGMPGACETSMAYSKRPNEG